jgi:hypothetical protein
MRAAIASILFSATAMAAAACSVSSGEPESGRTADDIVAQDACAGKTCGEPCSLCDGQPDCFESAVLKACNAEGRCTTEEPVCTDVDAGPGPGDIDGGPAPYDPCGDKQCGDTCSLCSPDDPNCVETGQPKVCQYDGSCSSYPTLCAPPKPYIPCENKLCGDSCTHCSPGDPSCAEPAGLKFCQTDGSCEASIPQFCF